MKDHERNRLIHRLARAGGKKTPALVLPLVLALIGYVLLRPALEKRFGWELPDFSTNTPSNTDVYSEPTTPGERSILRAFENRSSNVIVEASATIKKLLPDDRIGDRHQKMILRLPSGHTLLLAHNIDLADRVPADEGDIIEFRGEYEFSEQGGVIHWTHHDPRGRHPKGWVRHQGTVYE